MGPHNTIAYHICVVTRLFSLPQTLTILIIAEYSGPDENENCIYLCGNSLGLKPKMADEYMKEQLEMWGKE
jgi:kynureninase